MKTIDYLTGMLTRKCLVLVTLLLISRVLEAQPYATGRRALTVSDPTRSNRSISVQLYYPAAASGTGTPLPAGTTAFALVVFGHGFLIPVNSYGWLGDSLSKQGYLVAFPETEGSASPDHAAFGEDIAFLCRYLPTLNDSSGSFLRGRISNRVAAGGHSMGGGASLLAVSGQAPAQAVFNFAAAETNPSAKAAAGNTGIPALIFSGSRDCIVRDSNQLSMYNRIPYPCKTYVNITDALHCHFANNNSTCATGQFFSGCNSSPVNATTVFEKTIHLLIPFLDYYLNDSCDSKNILENRLNNLSGISYQRSCNADPFICSRNEYIFTGNGNWSDPVNWLQNRVPPAVLPAGNRIRIRPVPGGMCILDSAQEINAGSILLVEEDRQLMIPGNLQIR